MNSNYKSYNVTCTLNGTANALNDAGRQPNLISCPCECSDLSRLLKIEESHEKHRIRSDYEKHALDSRMY